jgi:hypothetical protein
MKTCKFFFVGILICIFFINFTDSNNIKILSYILLIICSASFLLGLKLNLRIEKLKKLRDLEIQESLSPLFNELDTLEKREIFLKELGVLNQLNSQWIDYRTCKIENLDNSLLDYENFDFKKWEMKEISKIVEKYNKKIAKVKKFGF